MRLMGTMTHWTFDPLVLSVLAISAGLYFRGLLRLRRQSAQGELPSRIALYLAGWLALVVALLSPVAALSEVLFAVHMTQHEILIVIAAPLLVAARPLGVLLHGLPTGTARRVAGTV